MTVIESTLQTPTEYAAELLDLAANALTGTAGGAISRRFLSPGQPVFDCEFVAVELTSIGEANTGPLATPLMFGKRHIWGRVNLLGFRVWVVRDCAPTLSGRAAPAAAALTSYASQIHEDVWAVWTAVYAEMRSGSLFGGLCSDLLMGTAEEVDTSGQFAGYTIDLQTEVNGLAANAS